MRIPSSAGQVFWGRGLSCRSWKTKIAGTASAIAPVPPLLCAPVHPPLDAQKGSIVWHPGVLGRGTFVEL